jgi:guanyl-specific ribonuclease Sa
MAKKRRSNRSAKPEKVSRTNPAFGWGRLVRLLLVCGIIAYLVYRQQQEHRPVPAPPPERPTIKVEIGKETPPSATASPADDAGPSDEAADSSAAPPSPLDTANLKTVVEDATIRSQEGEVVHRGRVDLAETIDRIQRGEKLPQFQHDGIAFGNREGRLPKKPAGYYREWVHPTPDLSGPGPQRIVTGAEGEFWYSPDHYRSFVSLQRDSGDE